MTTSALSSYRSGHSCHASPRSHGQGRCGPHHIAQVRHRLARVPPRFVHPERQNRDGFASQVDEVRSFAEQLITSGTATRPFLLVASKGGAAADGSAKYAAAVLTDVLSGAPGDQAELQHARRSSPDPVPGRAASRCVGDQVTIRVVGSASGKEINLALLAKATTSR